MKPSDLPNRTTFKTITEPSILVTPAMLLSEPQTIAIIHATGPLQERERAALLTELITLLAGRHEIGDGELGRMLARLQRTHFKPPSDVEVGLRDFQYRHMDGAPQARVGTDFFREMRQRQEAATAPGHVT